ncbi:hypothetical protein QAD02_005908, partial [Eretmocerus hayati]
IPLAFKISDMKLITLISLLLPSILADDTSTSTKSSLTIDGRTPTWDEARSNILQQQRLMQESLENLTLELPNRIRESEPNTCRATGAIPRPNRPSRPEWDIPGSSGTQSQSSTDKRKSGQFVLLGKVQKLYEEMRHLVEIYESNRGEFQALGLAVRQIFDMQRHLLEPLALCSIVDERSASASTDMDRIYGDVMRMQESHLELHETINRNDVRFDCYMRTLRLPGQEPDPDRYSPEYVYQLLSDYNRHLRAAIDALRNAYVVYSKQIHNLGLPF